MGSGLVAEQRRQTISWNARFLVILDRDGTINRDTHYLSDVGSIEILPGAIEGLKALSDKGACLVIATNQSGVGRGYFSLETARAVNDAVMDQLAEHGVLIDAWAMCPHAPDSKCDCRKPATRMADWLASATGLEAGASWVIGDKPSDVRLGVNIGGQGILIGDAMSENCGQFSTVPDLRGAASVILDNLGAT